MDAYDPTKVGTLLAGRFQGDHFVYAYGADEVIKFSKFDFLFGFAAARKKIIADYEICERYFGEYLLPTRLALSHSGARIALIQPRVAGHALTIAGMADPMTASQFKEIAARYRAMTAAGYAGIDLIGHEGLFRGRLGNIIVTHDKQLRIFDAMSLDLGAFSLLRPFLVPLIRLLERMQRRLMERYVAAAMSLSSSAPERL